MSMPRYGLDGRTVAVLVAGRTLSYEVTTYTVAMIEEIMDIAERHGRCAVVPGSDLKLIRESAGPDARAYQRVAIGIEVAVAYSDVGRPVQVPDLGRLRAAVRRVSAEFDPFFWRRIAKVLEPAARSFEPAMMRASAVNTGHAGIYAGMSLDGRELREAADELYLAVAGPLPSGDLWYGRQHTPQHRYLDPDGDAEWDLLARGPHPDRISYGSGQGPGQDAHEVWVHGVHVVNAAFDTLGVVPVDLSEAAHRARVELAGGLDGAAYQLYARYD